MPNTQYAKFKNIPSSTLNKHFQNDVWNLIDTDIRIWTGPHLEPEQVQWHENIEERILYSRIYKTEKLYQEKPGHIWRHIKQTQIKF